MHIISIYTSATELTIAKLINEMPLLICLSNRNKQPLIIMHFSASSRSKKNSTSTA